MSNNTNGVQFTEPIQLKVDHDKFDTASIMDPWSLSGKEYRFLLNSEVLTGFNYYVML